MTTSQRRWTPPPLRNSSLPERPRHNWRLVQLVAHGIMISILGDILPDRIVKRASHIQRCLFERPRRRRRRSFPSFVVS